MSDDLYIAAFLWIFGFLLSMIFTLSDILDALREIRDRLPKEKL